MKQKCIRKIFITYGSKGYEVTLKRICREAKALNFFDKIIAYHPKDLPLYIQASPLMAYRKGGGYWVWKPYLIWQTLQEYPDATVFYADAGCSLFQSPEWEEYYKQSQIYNTIVFQYRSDYDYHWNDFGCTNPQIEFWAKQSVKDYFNSLFETSEWEKQNIIIGGFIIVRSNSSVLNDWMNITLLHPEFIIDLIGPEVYCQSNEFCQHRHDQSILTPIVRYYEKKKQCLVLDEKFESKQPNMPIKATRIGNIPTKMMKHFVTFLKLFLGDALYHKLHK